MRTVRRPAGLSAGPLPRGAINRLVPNYVTHMWMSTSDQGLGGHALRPLQVSANVAGRPVKLACQTAYPFEETILVKVEPDRATSFPLYFRIPQWCAKPRIAVNGTAVEAVADAKGFVRVQRRWAKGDAVALYFPMSVRVSRGFETEFPPLAKAYFSFKPPGSVREAAIALRERFLRAAAVCAGDPR